MKQNLIRLVQRSGHVTWIFRAAVVALTAALLITTWWTWIDDQPTGGSGYQNLRIAHNLVHLGVFSQAKRPGDHVEEEMFREPLPPIVLAGYMHALSPFVGEWESPARELNQSPQIRIVKSVNVLWGAVLAFAVFAAIVQITGSYIAAGIGAVAANSTLSRPFNHLETELEAAALLALSSFLICLAVSRRSPAYFALAGLAFGGLVLTKAAFLYVGIGLALVLSAWGLYLLVAQADGRQRALVCLLLFPLGVAVAIVPWMARNYAHFGTFQVTERGGFVLSHRVTKGQMTATEYLGSFYAWAPRYRGIFALVAPREFRGEIGELLGFEPADLRSGGRLVRFLRGRENRQQGHEAISAGRPQDADSFFWSGRAVRAKLTNDMAEEGHAEPRAAADAEIRRRALRTIAEDPLRHLATTPPFLWRGAAYTFPILLAFAAVALARRRLDMFAYALPALGAVLFHALFTHFLPRYGLPMDAVAVACFIMLMYMLVHWLLRMSAAGARRLTGWRWEALDASAGSFHPAQGGRA